MITSIEPKAGSWVLLVGPRNMNSTMLNAIARLGEGGFLRVLDGGNRFNAYKVARAARGRPDVMNRITVSRAFTCYQVLSLLESTPAIRVPFVVLDMLSTFYDESVQVGERKRLLRACIMHLERLAGTSTPRGAEAADGGLTPPRLATGGVVSVHPPTIPSQTAVELLGQLQASAVDTYFIQPVAPAPEPMRLF